MIAIHLQCKRNNTVIKAMYFCFIVLLIVAQTRVYTNTDNFLSNFFLLLFIYCKKSRLETIPTDVGVGFKAEGRRTVGGLGEGGGLQEAQEE